MLAMATLKLSAPNARAWIMMTDEEKASRLAGLLYLVVVVTGFFSLAYVPSRIPQAGDPQAMISGIAEHQLLFRFGIAAFLLNQLAFLLLPLVLFGLLKPAGHTAATMMVVFAVVSVPIGLVSVTDRLDALLLLADARYMALLGPQQLLVEVLLTIGEYRNGILTTMLFWGLWLLPFGYLVFKSTFVPKILGILLMLGCLGYLVDVFCKILVTGYADSPVARFVRKPAAIGELGTCLWLLLVGTKYRRNTAQVAEEATH